MKKKVEKIFGLHTVSEFIKVSPDKVINIWIQDSLTSKPILSISDMAKSIGLSVQQSKKENLDKITNKQNHQGVVLEIVESNDIGLSLIHI